MNRADLLPFLQTVREVKTRIAQAAAEAEAAVDLMGKVLGNSAQLELLGRDPQAEWRAAKDQKLTAEATQQRAKHELHKLFETEHTRWVSARNAVWSAHYSEFQAFKVSLSEIAASVQGFVDFVNNGCGALGSEGADIDRWGSEFTAAVIEFGQPHALIIEAGDQFRGAVFEATKTAVRDSKILTAVENLRQLAKLP